MTPKHVYDLPPNLTFDKASKQYRYRWPATGKRSSLGKDKVKAIEQAERLNVAARLEKEMRIHDRVNPTVSELIDSYIEQRIPLMPWAERTLVNGMARMNLYKKELGHLYLKQLDRVEIARWINARTKNGASRHKHRLFFSRLYEHAISLKWCDFNEAEAVVPYSRSMKLENNRVMRKRMSIEQFWTIHDSVPLYMQVAMQMALVTLQARQEVLNMQYSDIRDGYLYVIRKKTAGESDAAFIRIEVCSEIERIVRLSRSDNVASPYIVHSIPRSKQARLKPKPHPTWVDPQQFTAMFAYYRNRCGISEQYEKRHAPTFHEIRSLGSRMMKEAGVPESQISALLAHGSMRTSEIYMDGRDGITDDAFVPVKTSLVIKR